MTLKQATQMLADCSFSPIESPRELIGYLSLEMNDPIYTAFLLMRYNNKPEYADCVMSLRRSKASMVEWLHDRSYSNRPDPEHREEAEASNHWIVDTFAAIVAHIRRRHDL